MKNAEMVSAAEALLGMQEPPAAAPAEPILAMGMTASEFWAWWLPSLDPDVPDTHFHHFDFSPREHLVPRLPWNSSSHDTKPARSTCGSAGPRCFWHAQNRERINAVRRAR